MQNIKNFRVKQPTEKDIEKYGDAAASIRFFESEDGKDWYECQSLFADDTIKIMYDSNNIIRSVVDKPVPERGNIYAVSMFSPEGMSVAEIKGKLPDGFSISRGEWVFDGKKVISRTLTKEELIEQAQQQKAKLLSEAASVIAPLQDAADIGIATNEELQQLKAWKTYRVMLNRVDVSMAPDIEWPVKPE
jgi:sucrose-6-phosphate hydrolase SacC (GH32 family)